MFLGRVISRHNTYWQELAKTIDEEILNLIKSSYTRAKDIITQNRAAFDKLVETLLEKEVVESNEIDEILGLKTVAKEDAPLEPAAEENPQEETQEPKAEQAEPRQPALFE